MGFSLKKTFDKASGGIFSGGGSKKLQSYNAPNLDFLRTPATSVNYDFLKTAASDAGGLADQGMTAYDFLRPVENTRDQSFQDYITSISAPSSVDEAWSQVNNERLQSTIGDIERDTRGKFGAEMMSSFDRGLWDPSSGGDSDIARIGMAQVATGGARVAADARLKAYEDELARLTGKEKAVQGAYGQRYTTNAAGDLSRESMAADLASGTASGYNSLLGTGKGLEQNYLQSYASGLGSNAAAEEERKRTLANALLGVASGESAASKKTGSTLSQFLSGFSGGFGQGLGAGLGCFTPGTMIEMADGSARGIEDVEPGDVTRGGVVLETRKTVAGDVYDYKGIGVAGCHCVFDGEWRRVRDASGSVGPRPNQFIVHNLITASHRIYVAGIMFDDALETGEKAGSVDGHVAYLNQTAA